MQISDRPWRVIIRYRGTRSTTSFSTEEAARTYVAALKKRGVRNVYAIPV